METDNMPPQPIDRARADLDFQKFLAPLFGEAQRLSTSMYEAVGYVWRGKLYVARFERKGMN